MTDTPTKLAILKHKTKCKKRLNCNVWDWFWKGKRIGVSKQPEKMTSEEIDKLCEMLEFEESDFIVKSPIKSRYKKRVINPNAHCLCGCGSNVSHGSKFCPGHDSKLKKQLKYLIAQGDEIANKKAFDLGWMDICNAVPR